MKWKAFIPLAVALVLGLFAARMAMNFVGVEGPKLVEATNFTPIVVASRDIEAGTALAETDLSTIKVDSGNLPDGAFTTNAPAVGKVLKIRITKGQPVLPSVLADDGAGYGVAATLPKGFRLVTVDINDITGVAGFIQPQSRVDIVSTLQSDGKPVSKTLLQSVLVFAVGSRTNPTAPIDPNAPQQSHTITLLVKPEDAERIELAATTTRLRMVLRNGRDTEDKAGNGITLAELRGDKQDAAPDPFASTGIQNVSCTQPSDAPGFESRSWTIEIIKGGTQSTQTMQLPAKPETKPQQPKAETAVTKNDTN